MALGIESNNLAPALIQSNSSALIQGIRQIGQQVSGHLTEMQTKRDLAALGQEAQALNVESNEFPTQLAQLVTRHPLAARDERGLMALSAMGKAHGQWQATEAEARAFNRAMAMQGFRDRAADRRATATAAARGNEIVNIPNVGGVRRALGPDGKPEVVLPLPEDPEQYRSSSLGTYSTKTGLGPDGKPLKPKPAAASSSGLSQRRLIIESQLSEFDRDLNIGIREQQRLLKEEEDIKKELEGVDDDKKKAELEYKRTVKAKDAERALRKIEETQKKKNEALTALGLLAKEIETELGSAPAPVGMEPELGVVPPNAVAPPVNNPNALVPVINPSGKPTNIKRSQLEAALQSGYTQR